MIIEIFSHFAESWLLFAQKAVAEKRMKQEYDYGLLKVTGSLGEYNKVVAALEEIKAYDASLFDSIIKTVKRIIFVGSKGSDVFLSKRTILISENDQSHMASPIHLAGWLLYYYALLYSVKEIGLLRWSGTRYFKAKEEGKRLRENFLTGASPCEVEAGSGSETSKTKAAD